MTPLEKQELKKILSKEQIREGLLILAKDVCNKLGGSAVIGDGYNVVDTSKFTIIEKSAKRDVIRDIKIVGESKLETKKKGSP